MFSLTVFVSSATLHRGRWSLVFFWKHDCQWMDWMPRMSGKHIHHTFNTMCRAETACYATSRLLCYVAISEPHSALLHLATTLCYLISHTMFFKFKCGKFSNHHSLTFCSLGENEISDEGVCRLAGALQVNQSLQELK